MKKALGVLLIISISLTFLITSIESNSYNKSYYLKSFEENGVEETTGNTLDELGLIVDNIIEYLKGNGKEDLLTPYFNEKEVTHMVDVQDLFDIAGVLKAISLILSLIIIVYSAKIESTRELGSILFYGLFANHIILIVLGIIISLDFTRFWTFFHKIFFTNDLWLLNPKTDLMIKMLPEPFFSGIITNIVLSFFIYLAIIQLIGLYLMKRGSGKWRKKKR